MCLYFVNSFFNVEVFSLEILLWEVLRKKVLCFSTKCNDTPSVLGGYLPLLLGKPCTVKNIHKRLGEKTKFWYDPSDGSAQNVSDALDRMCGTLVKPNNSVGLSSLILDFKGFTQKNLYKMSGCMMNWRSWFFPTFVWGNMVLKNFYRHPLGLGLGGKGLGGD